MDVVSLYDSGSLECPIDLSDNTNRWGSPPVAIEAMRCFDPDSVARYPSAYTSSLKNAIGRYVSVDPAVIVTGCGSDDVLDSAIRAFGDPGDRLAFMDPSFGMIPVFARINGLVPIPFTLDNDLDGVIKGILDCDASILYLCSPNNPTGAFLGLADLQRIVHEFDGLVIVDQAYAEFCPESLTSLAIRNDNVLITRTMSKAFGLASLRIGYGIGSREIAREVEKSRGPYKVSAIAESVAIEALENGVPWVSEHVAKMKLSRDRFVAGLRALGFEPLPSEANFVLVPATDAAALGMTLRECGIGVRIFEDLAGLGGALRITIGPWHEMEACLSALAGSSR